MLKLKYKNLKLKLTENLNKLIRSRQRALARHRLED